MRFSPFDFDVITTPDELPPRKPEDPAPHAPHASDGTAAAEHEVPVADERPK